MKLTVTHESWPIRGSFTIARGSRTTAEVVVAELVHEGYRGRGECVPYGRYNESIEGVIAEIEAAAPSLTPDLTPAMLQDLMPAGAARKAVDCALWDLMAKRAGQPVWRLAGLPEPQPVVTAYTISIAEPDAMEQAARDAKDYPLLKVKLGCGSARGDAARVQAVRRGAPDARLIVDANEAWSMKDLRMLVPIMADCGIALIEQPLPADADEPLAGFSSAVPLCADESCHDRSSLTEIIGRYDLVNIKLNKTGGLTEAIELLRNAREQGLGVMIGCMVGTSLAMAPAALVAGQADFVDLDGPLLLAQDREAGLRYDNGLMHPPQPALWG